MTQPYKICPQCQTPAPLDAAFCGKCRRAYKTTAPKLPPPLNQTQVIMPPVPPSPSVPPVHQPPPMYAPPPQPAPAFPAPRKTSGFEVFGKIVAFGCLGLFLLFALVLGASRSNKHSDHSATEMNGSSNESASTGSTPLVRIRWVLDHGDFLKGEIDNISNQPLEKVVVVGYTTESVERSGFHMGETEKEHRSGIIGYNAGLMKTSDTIPAGQGGVFILPGCSLYSVHDLHVYTYASPTPNNQGQDIPFTTQVDPY